jgi:hypothetical protein
MYTWEYITELLRAYKPGTVLRVEAWQVQHPRDAGLLQTGGIGATAQATFRKPLDQTTLLHVREADGTYHVSLVPLAVPAKTSTTTDVTPGGIVLGTTALGALLGAALGGKNGALAGALVGGMAGLAAVGVDNAKSSPETATMAKDLFAALAQAVKQPAAKGAKGAKARTRKVAVRHPRLLKG